MSNTPESRRLRIKSMLSYEGYEEYYNHYVRWAENQGLVPDEKMTREFFDAQMSRMDSYARQQLAREAKKAGLPIPPNLLVQEDPYDRLAIAQAKKLDKPIKCPHCQKDMPMIAGTADADTTNIVPNRPALCVQCGGLSLTQPGQKLVPITMAELEFRGLVTKEDRYILDVASQRVKADKARGITTNIQAVMSELRNRRN